MPCVKSGSGLCDSCCWAWVWALAGLIAEGEVDCGAVLLSEDDEVVNSSCRVE